jgi:hypothetical protein
MTKTPDTPAAPALGLYRFRDLVAVNPPGGDSFYMTPRDARAAFSQLGRILRSIEGETFAGSPSFSATFPAYPADKVGEAHEAADAQQVARVKRF